MIILRVRYHTPYLHSYIKHIHTPKKGKKLVEKKKKKTAKENYVCQYKATESQKKYIVDKSETDRHCASENLLA